MLTQNKSLGGQKLTHLIQGVRRGFTQARKLVRQNDFSPYVMENYQIEGCQFDFLIGDMDGEEWYRDNNLAANPHPNIGRVCLEMRFVKEKMVAAGDTIFECGGHHGCTGLMLSQWVGATGKVVSFEPNPDNIEIFSKNIAINQTSNLLLEKKALGRELGSLKIFRKSNGAIATNQLLSVGTLKNFFYGVEEVEVTTLDSYARNTNLHPNLLKIDVEGYEAEVLKGATEILRTAPKLAIELHTEILGRYGTSVKEILDLIDVSRYQCWVQWNLKDAPVPFDLQQEIDRYVHLFCIPL
jgi:FkbM family methyltransferase